MGKLGKRAGRWRWLLWLGIAIAALGLGGCGALGGPSQAVVTQALTQQGAQVQARLWQLLGDGGEAPAFTVDRVSPQQTRRILWQGERAYEVQGEYRFSLRYPSGRRERHQGPFRVLLQRGQDGKVWQWISPSP